MKRRCMALLAAGMLALLTAGCGQTGAGGTLTVGVRDDIINFGYLNEKTGKYYGLEIDIAQEMAERMGYGEVEFVTVTPDNRKEMLLDGKVDCLIATYTISDTRLENFDFSPAYYQDNMQVVVEKSSMVNDISELKGLNIGTMSGANAAPLLAIKLNELGLISNAEVSEDRTVEHLDDITITKIPSYDEVDAMLESGEIDAACMDHCIAETYMNDDRKYLDTVITEQEYGVATQKGSKLSKEVKSTIQEMLDDGTIDQMIDKWD